MTQIASMLAVATVFVSLWTLISRQGLIHETKVPIQELEPAKSAGGLICEGGRNFGILQ